MIGFAAWFDLFGVSAATELDPGTPRTADNAQNP
jgi:hypothetical protein